MHRQTEINLLNNFLSLDFNYYPNLLNLKAILKVVNFVFKSGRSV